MPTYRDRHTCKDAYFENVHCTWELQRNTDIDAIGVVHKRFDFKLLGVSFRQEQMDGQQQPIELKHQDASL